jgi:hypothetical protein
MPRPGAAAGCSLVATAIRADELFGAFDAHRLQAGVPDWLWDTRASF